MVLWRCMANTPPSKYHAFYCPCAHICKLLKTKFRIQIYKQFVLLLVEYVSAILYLTTKCERDKLQKIQNRVLRQIFNAKTNQEYSTSALHDMPSIQTLNKRRMLQLMLIMYQLLGKGEYQSVHIKQGD